MKKIAVISAILEEPKSTQAEFNQVIAAYSHMVCGRMGLPFPKENISVISITVAGEVDEINSLTGKLGNLKNIQVKTAISKKELNS